MCEVEAERVGLADDWCFEVSGRLRSTIGICRFNSKTIEIAAGFAGAASDEELRDTIRHEIAHALSGPRAEHGPLWKATCVLIGCRPEQYLPLALASKGYRGVAGKCEKCAHLCGLKARAPKRGYTHTGCGGKVIWVHVES